MGLWLEHLLDVRSQALSFLSMVLLSLRCNGKRSGKGQLYIEIQVVAWGLVGALDFVAQKDERAVTGNNNLCSINLFNLPNHYGSRFIKTVSLYNQKSSLACVYPPNQMHPTVPVDAPRYA